MLEIARFAAERRARTAALATGVSAGLAAVGVAVADPGLVAALGRLVGNLSPGLRAVVAGSLPRVASVEAFLAVIVYRLLWLGGLGPLVAAVAAGVVAGEAETGSLDLTLAQPVTRRRLAAEGFLGVAPLVVLVDLGIFVAVSLGLFALGHPVPLARLVVLHGVGLCYLLAAAGVGLVAGVATHRLRLARGLAAGTVAWLFLVDGLSRPTDTAWVGEISPSRYIDPGAVLVDGAPWIGGAVMLAAAVVAAVLVAAWIFERRDLAG